MSPVELKILDARLPGWGFPHWGSELAAGLDLFACLEAPLDLPPGDKAVLVPAGFALSIGDAGWAALIYPRSGLGHKKGLVLGNAVGVIDADYQGPVMISVWNRNVSDGTITIQPGERIAQMVFTRIGRPAFRLVQDFDGQTIRGEGGFGSTGVGGTGNITEGSPYPAEPV